MMIEERKTVVILFLMVSALQAAVAAPEKEEAMIIDHPQLSTGNMDNNSSTVETKMDTEMEEKVDPDHFTTRRLIIWEVDDDERHPSIKTSSTAFESKKCYIIQKTHSNPAADDLLTYYWVGEYASEGIASNAARSAVLLDHDFRKPTTPDEPIRRRDDKPQLRKPLLSKPGDSEVRGVKTKIQREVQDYETSNFVNFLERYRALHLLSRFSAEPVEIDDSKAEQMFVLSGNDDTTLQEVEVSLRVLQKYDVDYCIIFVSETVHVFCGSGAFYTLKRGAEELAKIMLKKRGRKKTEYIFTRDDLVVENLPVRDRVKASPLFAELPYKPLTRTQEQILGQEEVFTPEQLKAILNPGRIYQKRDFSHISMDNVRVYPNCNIVKTKLTERGDFLGRSEVDKIDCYICSIESNRGLVVWMGAKSSLNVRAQCAREAELYLRRRNYYYAMPITYFDEEEEKRRTDLSYIGSLFNTMDRTRMDPVSLYRKNDPIELD